MEKIKKFYDIVVNIPEKELDHFWNDKSLDIEWWTLKRLPIKLNKGCYIYFSSKGILKARAKIKDIKKCQLKCEITNRLWDGYNIIWDSKDFQKIKDKKLYDSGFRGFRYYEE